jgi:hypothetical protein
MLLGGLWHGASWNFVFWGGLHGMALAIHKLWMDSKVFPKAETGSFLGIFKKGLSWLATYIFVCFAWIFFRAQDFPTALIIIKKVVGIDADGVDLFYTPFFAIVPVFIIGHIIGIMLAQRAKASESRPKSIAPPDWIAPLYNATGSKFAIKPSVFSGIYALLPFPGFIGSFLITLWIIIIYLFSPLGTNPFIYFQF